MYKTIVFCRPPCIDFEKLSNIFNLENTLHNDRTSIYENDEVMFSFDKKVVRVFLYNTNDKTLLKRIKEIFYEK